MSQLLSFIFNPLTNVNTWSDDDTREGIDVFYPLSAFFAFGIWLVFQRYQRAHNSAVPIDIHIPVVFGIPLMQFQWPYIKFAGSRPKLGVNSAEKT